MTVDRSSLARLFQVFEPGKLSEDRGWGQSDDCPDLLQSPGNLWNIGSSERIILLTVEPAPRSRRIVSDSAPQLEGFLCIAP